MLHHSPTLQAVPAMGNTGQLAMDLLLLHLCAQPVATIESVNVLPVAGNDALATSGAELQGSPCTSLQLFKGHVGDQSVLLLQQRGPVATGRHAAFAAELAQWAREAAFAEVLLISSADASWRTDAEIQGPQVTVLPPPQQEAPPAAAAVRAAGVPLWPEAAAHGTNELGAVDSTWQTHRTGPWCAPSAQALRMTRGCFACKQCHSCMACCMRHGNVAFVV